MSYSVANHLTFGWYCTIYYINPNPATHLYSSNIRSNTQYYNYFIDPLSSICFKLVSPSSHSLWMLSVSASLCSASHMVSQQWGLELSQKPLTVCVCEKDPHWDINPQNNVSIDNAWERLFEAMENRRGDKGAGRRDSFLWQLRRYHSPIHGCTQVYYLLFN